MILVDRRGGLHDLVTVPGDTVATALLRNGVPPASVLVWRDPDDQLVHDHMVLDDKLYLARLIEGYDIEAIRSWFLTPQDLPDGTYAARRLVLSSNGKVELPTDVESSWAAASAVKSIVHETISHYDLVDESIPVVLGLSGGIDSGSLLMLLAQYRDSYAPNLPIHAVTFEDYDSRYSDTFPRAKNLAHGLNVEHSVIEASAAERVFHVRLPIAEVLVRMMDTPDRHLTMYVDHHSTRRLIEDWAEQNSPKATIALGLHATDLVAGYINSLTAGYPIGAVPKRTVGSHTYVFPLAFVPKRELHIYYSETAGTFPVQTRPNMWEFDPADRNFLYYLADQLQWFWPGLQHWLLTTRPPNVVDEFVRCENCAGEVRLLPGVATPDGGLCDVCDVLNRNGFLLQEHEA